MAETEDTLRVEVSRVCRTYSSQVWNEALNQVGVEASSVLRRAESMYYPSVIWKSIPSGSRTDTTSEVREVSKDSLVSVPTSFDKPTEEAKQPRATEKEKNANQGMAPDAMKPSVVTRTFLLRKKLLRRRRLSWPPYPQSSQRQDCDKEEMISSIQILLLLLLFLKFVIRVTYLFLKNSSWS